MTAWDHAVTHLSLAWRRGLHHHHRRALEARDMFRPPLSTQPRYTAPETLWEALGVRFAEGDGGAAPAAAPAAAEAAPTLEQAVAARVDPPTAEAQAPAEWDGNVESLPPAVQKVIKDLRKEAGDRRTALSQREQQMDAIAVALGLKQSEEQAAPDPAQITERLTAAQTQARQASVELAVFRTAGATGADPDALLDSRAFNARIDALDPTAEDFTTQITTAIAETLAANPKLKAGRAPGASSVDHSAGGPGEGRAPRKPRPLHQSVSGVYGV